MCELTRDKLHALRKAHGFYIYAKGDDAEITCKMESDFGKSYDEIARVNFKIGLVNAIPAGRRGYVNISSCRFDHCWTTIASFLKVGDRLSVEFRPDWHSNGYARAAKGDGTDPESGRFDASLVFNGLHADVCYLLVDRQAGGKTKRLCFLLDVNVCPDNTARMIAAI